MTYTLDQLRCLVVVAEELHFGRAAHRLRMTQPPLSRQIQKLEFEVGTELLTRDKRRVALTPAGEVFLGEARRILALVDTAPDLARRVSEGSTGLVRLGFTAASAFGVLGELLNEASRKLPEIYLDLYEMVTREQVDALTAGDLDVGLARPPFDTTTFNSRLIHREALLLAVPFGHRLASFPTLIAPSDLAGEPLIMHSQHRAKYFYDLVANVMPFSREQVVHSVSQIMTMLWLVQAGRGLAFVPGSAYQLNIPGVRLVGLATPVLKPVELHLIWKKHPHNPALRPLLDVFEELKPSSSL